MIKKTIKQIKTSQAQAQKTADHLNQEVIVVAQNKQHIQDQAGMLDSVETIDCSP
jgi:hypothetical protein